MTFFLFFAQYIDCGYTLEPSWRGVTLHEHVIVMTHRKRNLTWHYSTFSLRKPVHAIYSIVSAVLIKVSRFFIIIFLIIAQNIDCGYTLEPPRRGGSNEYPQSMF